MSQTDFWKLNEDILFKRAGGKVLWQPRIDCWYSDRIFANGDLEGRYKGMSRIELYKDLGCSARLYEYNDCFTQNYAKDVTCSEEKIDQNNILYTIQTPVGTVTKQESITPSSWARKVEKEWVVTEQDLKVFTYLESTCTWSFSQECYDRLQTQWGRLGAPCIFIPRVNVQKLYIDLMGVEQAVYALIDYPETIETYFEALSDSHMRLIDLINQSPIDIINFGDNIHSGTLSPSLFEKYVLPEYQKRTAKLHEGGKFTYSHFDGDNRGLTHFYKQTGLDGIEAITPKPQGDITIEEAKEGMGEMYLFDGIPAIYFDEIYPVETLVECVEKLIALFAPNLILGISDEMSSQGDIERIRLVGELVDKYNASLSSLEC